jgi:hypothetical protein
VSEDPLFVLMAEYDENFPPDLYRKPIDLMARLGT